MSVADNVTVAYTSATTVPTGMPMPIDEKHAIEEKEREKITDGMLPLSHHLASLESEDGTPPTQEDLQTLRKVSAGMPWVAIGMCLIEFAERASYYGCYGVFSNFVRGGLPVGGNGAGAVAPGEAGNNQSAGALGLGSQVATALTQMFIFLAYAIPIFGGIVADTKWGRFKTICIGCAIGGVAHFLLVIPAIPSVIANPDGALGAFIISIIILAFAAGFIKPSLAPLLCDQSPVKYAQIKTLESGERVIVDPTTTVSSYMLIFYWCINIGAFFQVATTYAEHDVGFWLAYLTPGLVYLLMPIVLVMCYKHLYKAPPQGSVVKDTWRVVKYAFKDGGIKRMFKGGDAFWNPAKPSVIATTTGAPVDITVISWDDRFVDEIRQSFAACAVFMLIPVFNLADGGLGNSQNDMSIAMINNGVPNDLIGNFNQLTIVICAPILNYVIYPRLEKWRIPFPPMYRMALGFILGGLTMIYGAVLQWQVYVQSPCGYAGTSGTDGTGCFNADGSPAVVNLSLWLQIPLYALPAVGELLVYVTSYEIAYTHAPARMKGLVFSMTLFTTAISSAIGLALTPIVQDPYLVWPYIAISAASFFCAVACPVFFKHLNDPVVFNDPDRMEGRQQPGYESSSTATIADEKGSVKV